MTQRNLIDEYIRYWKGQNKLNPLFGRSELRFWDKTNPGIADAIRKQVPEARKIRRIE